MRFQIASVLAALATLVVADHTVSFVNQDGVPRDIIFTASPGHAALPKASLPAGGYTQTFPYGWQGNYYVVPAGAAEVVGILGEMQFDGYNGAHYYDVSAIVNPNDNKGVKEIYPKQAQSPVSGCQTYPGCGNCYNLPDDIATLSSYESDFVCLVGGKASARRHARHFVTGHHA